MSELGYTRYMFIDGDLPGNGDDPSLPGHEPQCAGRAHSGKPLF